MYGAGAFSVWLLDTGPASSSRMLRKAGTAATSARMLKPFVSYDDRSSVAPSAIAVRSGSGGSPLESTRVNPVTGEARATVKSSASAVPAVPPPAASG